MTHRLKFFLSHLSLSFLIALLVVGVVFFIWYPSPLATAVGVTHIFLMLIAIDVILGPILGLLVYKEGKKSLKMDLSIIIIIQLMAFGFGFYSIAQGRPAWIVFNQNSFELIRVNDIYTEHPESIPDEFKNNPYLGPKYVATRPSNNITMRSNDIFAEALGGISLAQRPERFVEINQQSEKIMSSAKPIEQLNQFNSLDSVQKILEQYPQANGWIPLKAIQQDMVVLMNQEQVVKVVDLRPWN